MGDVPVQRNREVSITIQQKVAPRRANPTFYQNNKVLLLSMVVGCTILFTCGTDMSGRKGRAALALSESYGSERADSKAPGATKTATGGTKTGEKTQKVSDSVQKDSTPCKGSWADEIPVAKQIYDAYNNLYTASAGCWKGYSSKGAYSETYKAFEFIGFNSAGRILGRFVNAISTVPIFLYYCVKVVLRNVVWALTLGNYQQGDTAGNQPLVTLKDYKPNNGAYALIPEKKLLKLKNEDENKVGLVCLVLGGSMAASQNGLMSTLGHLFPYFCAGILFWIGLCCWNKSPCNHRLLRKEYC